MIGFFFFFKLEYLKGKVKWHNTKNCKEYGYKKKKIPYSVCGGNI